MEDHLVSFAKKNIIFVTHFFDTKTLFWQFCILDIAVANEMGGNQVHCSIAQLALFTLFSYVFCFPLSFHAIFFSKKTFFLDF